MNPVIITIECIVLVVTFTAMILIPLTKNPVWWIHDFPHDIQEEYFKTHKRIPSAFFSPIVLVKKSCALLLCLLLFMGLIWLAGAQSFCQAFVVSYGLWLVVNWYDCFILDWIFFANIKAVRLPGTEHMDKEYHQKRYHFVRSCYGSIIGLIPCLVASALYTLIIS